LSRYMFTQNFIELSAAVHELSIAVTEKKLETKTIQSIATARTVKISWPRLSPWVICKQP